MKMSMEMSANFSCKLYTGIKWERFPPKTMGKNHRVFLRKPKQTRVQLQGDKWKTFLAKRKRSELGEKMKRKTSGSLWILYNTSHGGGCIESKSLGVRVSYPQFCDWIAKIVWNNGIGYC